MTRKSRKRKQYVVWGSLPEAQVALAVWANKMEIFEVRAYMRMAASSYLTFFRVGAFAPVWGADLLEAQAGGQDGGPWEKATRLG